MNSIESGLLLVAGAAALACVGAPLFSHASQGWRALLSGALTCLVGLGGVFAGVGALSGGAWSLTVPRLLPLSEAVLAVDPLSGFFMTVVGAVAIATGIYSVAYPHSHDRDQTHDPAEGVSSTTAQAALPLFAAAMVAVPAAGNVTTFLVFWELMALVSLILVLAEHRERPEVGQAGAWYGAMTHAGLVAILLGLVVFATAAGTETFAGMRAASSGLSPATSSLVFVLVFAGFGSKAGLVPLHVWLPRAHP
ncbi:proton-conducting transporter transmembrane domain-containing protein [Georgenia sp.]